MKIAKAGLVPTEHNLCDNYGSFAELEQGCAELSGRLNARPHSVTRRLPDELLAVEARSLHAIPDEPFTAAFGESRSVSWASTVTYRSARYSVPDHLAGGRVWVRATTDELVVVAGEGRGATEVARHRLVGAGHASIDDAHYRHHDERDRLQRTPRATKPSHRLAAPGRSRRCRSRTYLKWLFALKWG